MANLSRSPGLPRFSGDDLWRRFVLLTHDWQINRITVLGSNRPVLPLQMPVILAPWEMEMSGQSTSQFWLPHTTHMHQLSAPHRQPAQTPHSSAIAYCVVRNFAHCVTPHRHFTSFSPDAITPSHYDDSFPASFTHSSLCHSVLRSTVNRMFRHASVPLRAFLAQFNHPIALGATFIYPRSP